MAYPRISIDKIHQIIKLTQEGKSRRDISQEVCYSTITVYRYQKKYNLL